MYELIARILLSLVNLFVSKAEERAAWKKKIDQELKNLDSSGDRAAVLRKEYEELEKKLRQPSTK